MAITRYESAVRSRQVALFIEPANAYDEGLLKGIRQYAAEHRHWSVYLGDTRADGDFSWLANWQHGGILGRIESAPLAEAVARLGLPTVAVSASGLEPDMPSLVTKEALAARSAADYLRQRGLRSFATFGSALAEASDALTVHFRTSLQQQGLVCEAFLCAYAGKSEIERKIRIARWLEELPKPLGILVSSQEEVLIEACQLGGYSVPGDVSIIGCNDEGMLYEVLDKHLSTVIVSAATAGYQAAALLDEMMAGYESLHGGGKLAAAADALCRKDKLLSDALAFIRSHACGGITVMDVLNEIPLSRRVLEHRFRQTLGRTPHEEIMAVRLGCVKELLSDTRLPLAAIAERTGFKHAEYLSVVFKREIGLSPGRYRRLHNHKGPDPGRPPAPAYTKG